MTEPKWIINVSVGIEGDDEEEAERALRALERAGRRADARVNFYVMASGEGEG